MRPKQLKNDICLCILPIKSSVIPKKSLAMRIKFDLLHGISLETLTRMGNARQCKITWSSYTPETREHKENVSLVSDIYSQWGNMTVSKTCGSALFPFCWPDVSDRFHQSCSGWCHHVIAVILQASHLGVSKQLLFRVWVMTS